MLKISAALEDNKKIWSLDDGMNLRQKVPSFELAKLAICAERDGKSSTKLHKFNKIISVEIVDTGN